MINTNFLELSDAANKPKLFVRISTSSFVKKNGSIVRQKELKILKRKTYPIYNDVIREDIMNVGADTFLNGIINFDEVEDGVYEMHMVNISTDWESGYIDGWDWKLYKIN